MGYTYDIRANNFNSLWLVYIVFQIRRLTFFPAVEFLFDSGTDLKRPQEKHNLQKNYVVLTSSLRATFDIIVPHFV